MPAAPPDRGLTHVALPVADTVRSAGFYERFADMIVVHRRVDPSTGAAVVWLSDLTRPFVIVLIETTVSHRLGGYAHLGVGCESRADVDARCAAAAAAGHEVLGPFDDGPPVGYWAIVADPDGHNLELSHGQEVAFTVASHDAPGRTDGTRR
ncbi:MAG TPA: VOC family protein [Acidimicrobiia bacterium]|nr:VOC family protein [Acidimicrobiia bacterium]